ncbi:MAG: hypothetical protein DHS20C03_35510 [Minwuia thermotolerans]|nr:MAG: hypothetical protein DHS20C03_35510 [Minwuia thermotolerans]
MNSSLDGGSSSAHEDLRRFRAGLDSGFSADRFVARDDVLGRVDRFLSGSSGQGPRILLIRGEGGAGKTWLTQALHARLSTGQPLPTTWSSIEFAEDSSELFDLAIVSANLHIHSDAGYLRKVASRIVDVPGKLPNLERFQYALERYFERFRPYMTISPARRARVAGQSEDAMAAAEVVADVSDLAFEAFGGAGKVLRRILSGASKPSLKKRWPELEGLDSLSEREHRQRVSQYFVEDLRRAAREMPRGERLMLIVDNIDAIEDPRYVHRTEYRGRWLRDLVEGGEGPHIIIVGRTPPRWLAVDGRTAGRPKLEVLHLGELSRGAAEQLLARNGISSTPLIAAIAGGNRLPMVLKEKCAWVLEETLHRGMPSPDDVPDTLHEIYDRLLLFRSADERELMTALAVGGRFDGRMMSSLARHLNTPVSQDGRKAIVRSASIEPDREGWFKFHDLLNEHLLEALGRDEAARSLGDRERTMRDAIVEHLVLERAEASPMDRADLLHWAFGLTDGHFGEDVPGSPDPAVLSQALEATEGSLAALASFDPHGVGAPLGRAAIECALAAAHAPSRQQAMGAMLRAALRILHLLCPMLYRRWDGNDAELAIRLVREVRGAASRHLERSHDDCSLLDAEMAALDLLDVRARRALPPEYSGRERPIRATTAFVREQEAVVDRLVDALGPDGRPDWLPVVQFAATAQSELSHQLGRLGRAEDALTRFRSASDLFADLMRDDDGPEPQFAHVWHLLHPPAGLNVDPDDLMLALRSLEKLRKARPRDLKVVDLWVRGLIRLAMKRRDGEIASEKAWYSPLATAEAALLDISRSRKADVDLLVVRLFLRILRKRRELDAPPSEAAAEIFEIVRQSVPQLFRIVHPLFVAVMRELGEVVRRERAHGGRIARDVLAVSLDGKLSPSQRGVVAQMLYSSYRYQETCLGIEPDISLSDVRQILLRDQPVLVGGDGLDFLRQVHAESVRKAEAALLGGASYDDMAAVFRDAMQFYSRVGRDQALTLAKGQLVLAKRLYGADLREAARAVLDDAEEPLRLYGCADLSHYVEALTFKVEAFDDTLSKGDAGRYRSKANRIANKIARENRTVGSLLYSSSERRNSSKQNMVDLGARMAFEALAIAESTLDQESQQRRQARSLFGEWLWTRLMDRNLAQGRRFAKGEHSALPVPRKSLGRFIYGQQENLEADLAELMSSVPAPGYAQGSTIAAKVDRIVPDGPKAGVVFRFDGREVLVQRELLGRNLYGRLRAQVPGWMPDDDAFDAQDAKASGTDGYFILNLLKPRDGLYGTMVGPVFVENCLRLFLPGVQHRGAAKAARRQASHWVTTGGSQTWAVVRLEPKSMSMALAGGGRLKQVLEAIVGLRRLTFVPMSHPSDPTSRLTEMRHFVNNTWDELSILELGVDRLVVEVPEHLGMPDQRKLRTWRSMAGKVYPGLDLNIIWAGLDHAGGETDDEPMDPDVDGFDPDIY